MLLSRSRLLVAFTSLVVASAVAACSSAGDPQASSFTNEHGQGGDGTGAGTNGGGGGGPSLGGLGGGDAGAIDAACVTSSAKAVAQPIYLVFMFDRSGSMKDNAKWTSCASGIKSFFADATSQGVSASLQFFAQQGNECSVQAYAQPLVPMKALPDANTFATAIASVQPNGGTPTLPALEGAIAYAKQVQQQHADGNVAVVLVTDGDPNDCNSTPSNVAQAAATVAQTIPTYVIGVGDSLTNLKTIAQGGGTGDAILVSTTNPTQITQDFEKAIAQIRQNAIRCDYAIPAPPNGQQLDPSKVNVVANSSSGSTTLAQDPSCKSGGWRYDDAAHPTKVLLCPSACDALKKDKSAEVNVLFGCATKVAK